MKEGNLYGILREVNGRWTVTVEHEHQADALNGILKALEDDVSDPIAEWLVDFASDWGQCQLSATNIKELAAELGGFADDIPELVDLHRQILERYSPAELLSPQRSHRPGTSELETGRDECALIAS